MGLEEYRFILKYSKEPTGSFFVILIFSNKGKQGFYKVDENNLHICYNKHVLIFGGYFYENGIIT